MYTKVAMAYGVVTGLLKQQTRIPICEHIYIFVGVYSHGDRYYFEVTRYVLGWKSTLHIQGQGGPIAIEMTRANSTGAAEISKILIKDVSDAWTTQLRQDRSFTMHGIFVGPDGQQYCWKSIKFSLGGDLQVNAYSYIWCFFVVGSVALPD